MKNSLAYGNDEIDSITIKSAAAIIALSVTYIINLSLGTGIFLPKWKIARTIPLLKSKDADANNPCSFRPVAQLGVISKLAEKCVQIQLLEFLEETCQLNTSHHAYRKLLSTSTAIRQITDRIGQAIDNNEIAATMGVDQSAAFDCFPRSSTPGLDN